jgi:hypothetical protein
MAFDVWVDFNSMTDGVVHTLVSFASAHVVLTAGRVVVVGDDDGTIAKARVESVEGDVVTLRVDTSSFVPETASPIARLAQ